MYEELVKALRGCVLTNPCDGCPYYAPNGPTKECATMNFAAADAIEELSYKYDNAVKELVKEAHDKMKADTIYFNRGANDEILQTVL